MNRKIKLAFLLTHPIQYWSPFFRKLTAYNNLDFIVYYCSNESIRGAYEANFKTHIKWDIPLLSGYRYKFLRNNSPFPTLYKPFFGLINFEIIKELLSNKSDVLIIFGWNFASAWIGVITAKMFKTKVFVFNETPLKVEMLKPRILRYIKKVIYKFLFMHIDVFLTPGEGGERFFRYYGIKKEKILKIKYAVDNDFFSDWHNKLKNQRHVIRKQVGIPEANFILLFVGKLIPKKDPMIILKALNILKNDKISAIFVGDGPLKEKLICYTKGNGIKNIFFPGFKNQTELPVYYAISDVLILPSIFNETWGLVVNEGMNFGLPIIASDKVGCANELVIDGYNGFVFDSKDAKELSNYIYKLTRDKKLHQKLSKNAHKTVENFTYKGQIKKIIAKIENLISDNNKVKRECF